MIWESLWISELDSKLGTGCRCWWCWSLRYFLCGSIQKFQSICRNDLSPTLVSIHPGHVSKRSNFGRRWGDFWPHFFDKTRRDYLDGWSSVKSPCLMATALFRIVFDGSNHVKSMQNMWPNHVMSCLISLIHLKSYVWCHFMAKSVIIP